MSMSFGNPLLISLQIVQLPGRDAVLGIFALEHCGAVDENGTFTISPVVAHSFNTFCFCIEICMQNESIG